jgi:hypothetical protein
MPTEPLHRSHVARRKVACPCDGRMPESVRPDLLTHVLAEAALPRRLEPDAHDAESVLRWSDGNDVDYCGSSEQRRGSVRILGAVYGVHFLFSLTCIPYII